MNVDREHITFFVNGLINIFDFELSLIHISFWPFASARDGNYRNLQMWYYRGNTNGRTNASDKWQPTGIGMMKYINPKDCNTNNGKIYDKVDCAIRYADILLMYAEALNELTPGSSFEVATWDGRCV